MQKFSFSFAKRPRTSSTKDGAPPQYIWAMVTEKALPSGTYHMSCIYVLQSRDTDVHIKKTLAILSHACLPRVENMISVQEAHKRVCLWENFLYVQVRNN